MVPSEGRPAWGRPASRGPYPVGSGDAFLAGLIAAVDGGAGWEAAFRAAVGAGAANAELPGAAILDAGRAEELAASAEISPC